MSKISDERREVAELLREVDTKHIENTEDMAQALAVCVTPETDYNFTDFPPALFARLADLIDPTCHVVPFDEESMRLPHCSKCGQPMLKPWPKFCPNCGARVTGGGDA